MIRRAWRIVKARHATTAFDGEGARLNGGRWNSPSERVVYASATKSLAALETLVHLIPPVTFKYVAIPIEFEESLIEAIRLGSLPFDWGDNPPPPSAQAIGDIWVEEARSAILELPSAIVPSESNYLLNPLHPDFHRIVIGKPEIFSFDRRLL